jgi:hypothetical protein
MVKIKYGTITWIVITIILFELVYLCATNLMYLRLDPEITPVSSTAKTFTFEWDGNNAKITIVRANENVTIAVTKGQQFVCDKSTNIYESNRFIFRVP